MAYSYGYLPLYGGPARRSHYFNGNLTSKKMDLAIQKWRLAVDVSWLYIYKLVYNYRLANGFMVYRYIFILRRYTPRKLLTNIIFNIAGLG